MFNKLNKLKSKTSKTEKTYAVTLGNESDFGFSRRTTDDEVALKSPRQKPSASMGFDSNEAILNAHGASLQSHNRELIKRMNDLRVKRDEVDAAISAQQQELLQYEEHLAKLERQLEEVDTDLDKKAAAKAEVERVLGQTEKAYNSIVQSSQSLLVLLERKEKTTEDEYLM